MGEERRRFPRVRQPFKVQYRVGEVGGAWEAATAINISAVGVRLRSDQPIEQGSRLELQIQLPASREPLDVLGIVVWNRMQAPNVTEVGVEFLNLTLVQQTKIDHLVQFLSNRV